MLRITERVDADARTFQLEGKLAGPWVDEVNACWQQALGTKTEVLRLDLSGVTMLDAAGKAFLQAAHAQGAKLVACGCLMRAIVAQITRSSFPEAGCR